MSNAAFVLMNCDLVAVPLQLGAGVVTVYCGARRADQLRGDSEAKPSSSGLGSVARRFGGSHEALAQRSACNSSSRSPMNLDGLEPRAPDKYAAIVDCPHGTRSASSC